jgi:hypothetical protein
MKEEQKMPSWEDEKRLRREQSHERLAGKVMTCLMYFVCISVLLSLVMIFAVSGSEHPGVWIVAILAWFAILGGLVIAYIMLLPRANRLWAVAVVVIIAIMAYSMLSTMG